MRSTNKSALEDDSNLLLCFEEAGDSGEDITFPNITTEQIQRRFSKIAFPDEAVSLDSYLHYLSDDVIPFSVNVSSPKYIGHMTSALPSFFSEISSLITRLNQNLVKTETSKSCTFLERQVVAAIHKTFYQYDEEYYVAANADPHKSFGIVTSGGTTANITAMWVARNTALIKAGAKPDDIKRYGTNRLISEKGYTNSVIIGTRLLHYSFKKCASLFGLGEESILFVEQDNDQRALAESLESLIEKCRQEGRLIIAIVGIAGATETGVIDPLSALGELANKHDIHFHVDAAWGGAFMLSDDYKHKLDGIQSADSVTFCPHKQLYLPQGISLCLFNKLDSLNSISTHANYQAQSGSFDLGQFSIEGSRPASSMLLHAAMHLIAQKGYSALLANSMQKTKLFIDLLASSDCFELVGTPHMNIVNYRYIPAHLRSQLGKRQFTHEETALLDHCVKTIQEKQFLSGESFVSKTCILSKADFSEPIWVFRVVISNPLTTEEHLRAVLLEQEEIGRNYLDRTESVVDVVSVEATSFEGRHVVKHLSKQ